MGVVTYHHIGAALQTKSGQVFSAVHIEATVGRIAVCAEAVAIGMAATAGDTEIEMIVAVNRVGQVVSRKRDVSRVDSRLRTGC